MALLWLKSPRVRPPCGADGCFAHLGCRGARTPNGAHHSIRHWPAMESERHWVGCRGSDRQVYLLENTRFSWCRSTGNGRHELFLRPDPSFWGDRSVGAGHLSIVNTHEFGLTRPSAAGNFPRWCRAATCSGCFRWRGCLASPLIVPAERPGSHAPFPASYPVVPPAEPWPFPTSYRVWRETTRLWPPGLKGTMRDPRKR